MALSFAALLLGLSRRLIAAPEARNKDRSGSMTRVKSGRMSALGYKWTFCGAIVMAAFPRADSLRGYPSGGILEM
jgi:hypothetical protein